MSRPRFLANHDLTEAILRGVVRREPAVEFRRLREVGLADRADTEVLEYAAREALLIVSHDVNTMTARASERLAAGQSMPGVLVAHQSDPIGRIIDDLVLIWAASEAKNGLGKLCFCRCDEVQLVLGRVGVLAHHLRGLPHPFFGLDFARH